MELTGFICLCIFIACLICNVTGKVSLEVMTNPIIFGKDVQIKCIFPRTNNCGYSRTWTCGPRYEPVVMNGISADKSKYQETQHKHCKYSTLTIKDFNESDADIVYKCTFGFDSYERVLELNQRKFEYHPKERISTRDVTIKENNIQINFAFKKIFPRPTCQGNIDREDITHSLKINNERNGVFYQTTVTLDHQKKGLGCIKSVFINCTVGNTTLTVADVRYTCNQRDMLTEKHRTSAGSANINAISYCFISILIIRVLTIK